MENIKKKLDNMKIEIPNRLKESVQEVVPMFLMANVEEENDIEKKHMPLNGQKITINISITGDLNGTLLLTMEMDTAKKIASTMTMDNNIEELNSFHESALREILNMIAGTLSCKISVLKNPYTNEVYGIDISSPISIITESDMDIWVDEVSFMKEITFNIDNVGAIKFYLTLKGLD